MAYFRNRVRMALLIDRKKFRHGAAVALGEKTVLTVGIGALLNGDRVIKPLPQSAVMKLFLTGQCQMNAVHRNKA